MSTEMNLMAVRKPSDSVGKVADRIIQQDAGMRNNGIEAGDNWARNIASRRELQRFMGLYRETVQRFKGVTNYVIEYTFDSQDWTKFLEGDDEHGPATVIYNSIHPEAKGNHGAAMRFWNEATQCNTAKDPPNLKWEICNSPVYLDGFTSGVLAVWEELIRDNGGSVPAGLVPVMTSRWESLNGGRVWNISSGVEAYERLFPGGI
jgi:hypothetical protein